MPAILHAHLALLGSLTPFLRLRLHLAALPFEVHAHTLLLLADAVNAVGLLAVVDGHGELAVLGHELSLGEALLLPLVLLLLRVNETLVLKLQ